MRPLHLLPALSVLALAAAVHPAVRWACIGNSLTAGYPQTSLAYPPVLQARLGGPGDTVLNAGVSAKTLQKGNLDSYWTGGRLPQVFAFKPHVVTIMLGTNDTKPQYWNTARYKRDLAAMVDTLMTLTPAPKIFLCLPPPIHPNAFDIRDSILTDSVLPAILEVAQAKGLPVMDFNTPLKGKRPLFHADGVHLTNAGRDSLAILMHRYYAEHLETTGITGMPTPRDTNRGSLRMVELLPGSSFGSAYGPDGRKLAPDAARAAGVRLAPPAEGTPDR